MYGKLNHLKNELMRLVLLKILIITQVNSLPKVCINLDSRSRSRPRFLDNRDPDLILFRLASLCLTHRNHEFCANLGRLYLAIKSVYTH